MLQPEDLHLPATVQVDVSYLVAELLATNPSDARSV